MYPQIAHLSIYDNLNLYSISANWIWNFKNYFALLHGSFFLSYSLQNFMGLYLPP